MPLYEYQCAKCHRVHEVMQKFSDEPLTACPDPDCLGPVSKLMSMSSFALKGSGWYTTDYKRKSAPAEAAPAAAPAAAAAAPAAASAPKPAGS